MIVNCTKVGRGMRGDSGAHIGGPHPFRWQLREEELLAAQPLESLNTFVWGTHPFTTYPLIQRYAKSAQSIRFFSQRRAEQSSDYKLPVRPAACTDPHAGTRRSAPPLKQIRKAVHR